MPYDIPLRQLYRELSQTSSCIYHNNAMHQPPIAIGMNYLISQVDLAKDSSHDFPHGKRTL